jgi:hypothetical protein
MDEDGPALSIANAAAASDEEEERGFGAASGVMSEKMKGKQPVKQGGYDERATHGRDGTQIRLEPAKSAAILERKKGKQPTVEDDVEEAAYAAHRIQLPTFSNPKSTQAQQPTRTPTTRSKPAWHQSINSPTTGLRRYLSVPSTVPKTPQHLRSVPRKYWTEDELLTLHGNWPFSRPSSIRVPRPPSSHNSHIHPIPDPGPQPNAKFYMIRSRQDFRDWKDERKIRKKAKKEYPPQRGPVSRWWWRMEKKMGREGKWDHFYIRPMYVSDGWTLGD